MKGIEKTEAIVIFEAIGTTGSCLVIIIYKQRGIA